MSDLRVLRIYVGTDVCMAAEEDDSLYSAMRVARWQSDPKEEGFFDVLSATAAAPLLAKLEGMGGWFVTDMTDQYVLGRTLSEPTYDGFGTIELAPADEAGWRTVAVRHERLEWQSCRYWSWSAM